MIYRIKTDEHFTIKKGDSTLNVDELEGELNNRLKYVLLSQAEYDSLTTKDSGTLYLIRGVKYMITLTGNSTNELGNISVNGESKTVSDFPLEVDEGSNFGFKHLMGNIDSTVTMGGTDITSSVRTTQNESSGSVSIPSYVYDITNITGGIVVTINSYGGGSAD